MRRLVVPLAVLLLAVLWGVAFVAIKLALREVSPASIALLRFAIASVLLLALTAIWPRARPHIPRDGWWRIVVLGATGVPAYHLALNWGELRTSASVAALIIASAPVMVAVASPIALGERLTARGWVGIALAFGGVALLAMQGDDAGTSTQLTGVLLSVVAAVSWAAYTIVAKPLTARVPPLQITIASLLVGSLMLLPLVSPGLFREAGRLSASGWGWIVWLGAGASAAGYVLFNYALTHMSATKVSVSIYLVPVVALISAWLILDEPLGGAVVAGAALVIAGVALAQRGGVRHDHQAEPLEHAAELRGG